MKPIWYPILVPIPLLIGVYVAWQSWPWWSPSPRDEKYIEMLCPLFLGGIFTFLLTAGAAGIASVISSSIGSSSDQIWNKCWSAKMVSLRSADGISGSISGGIFMLAGRVDSQQIYFYYTQNRDGSFQPHKWKADSDTAIFEEDREDGEIVQFDSKFKQPMVDWFGETNDRIRMEFHIPRGSLRQSFKLE